MRRTGLVCLASTLALTANSASPEWRRINRDTDRQSVIYVDMKSISLSGDRARGTILVVMASDRAGMAALSALAEFDCTAHRRRWFNMVGYDKDSKIVDSTGEEQSWKDVPEGSFYSGSEELICSGGKADIGMPTPGDLPIATGRKYLLDALD
jgi:hypothetical protein